MHGMHLWNKTYRGELDAKVNFNNCKISLERAEEE